MKINGINLSVATGTSSSLTYDLNGNLTSDGTNSYSWDAENRLLQITYPGSGNDSQFSYDSYGRRVSILEYTSSSLTSTKQFVWSRGNKPLEARNAGGSVTAQYFPYGETISGSSYFWTKDFPGSIREMTNASGTIVDQRAYDPFGRVSQLQGSIASDFQYAGYYAHAPSGLNLTRTRAYNPILARWLNRDSIQERGGINLYCYVFNDPISARDLAGTGDVTLLKVLTFEFEPGSGGVCKCKAACEKQGETKMLSLTIPKDENGNPTVEGLAGFDIMLDLIQAAIDRCKERCDNLFPPPPEGTDAPILHPCPCPDNVVPFKKKMKKAA